jgi:hypothetical protein
MPYQELTIGQVWNHAWNLAGREGACDAAGGREAFRLYCLWLGTVPLPDPYTFIIRQANRVPAPAGDATAAPGSEGVGG